MIIINKLLSNYKSLPAQVRASFWFLICSFLQKGISMMTTPIFTRIMNTAEYGQYGVFNSWYGIVAIIVSMSLSGGVHIQGLVKFNEDKNKFSSSLQGLTTVLVLGWTLVYFLFCDIWNKFFSLTTIQMVSMLALIWLTSIYTFWANEERVYYKYRLLVTITLIVSIAQPVAGIYLVLNSDDKVTARILGLVIVEFLGYSWMYVSQLRQGKIFFSKNYWKYALTFNLPLVPHYLSQTVLNSADRIMIQTMIGASEAGIYNLAYSLSLIMTLFNTALMQTLSPWIYEKIKNRKEKEIAPVAYMTLFFIACINLFLILLAPEAVSIFAPKEYYNAIWVIPPVALSVFFMYCYDLFAKFAFYYEKTKFVMIASVFGASLNVMLNFIFVSRFGYIAAGYTTLVCFIFYSIFHYLFMKKVCDLCCNGDYPYETKRILMIAVPFIIIGFALLATYKYPVIRYGIVIVVLIFVIIMRKKIINVMRSMLMLRKSYYR